MTKTREVSEIPATVPRAFLEDCIHFTRLFHEGGVACEVHGEEHQKEMKKRWPEAWMKQLFEDVGEFGACEPEPYYDPADELEEFWSRMEPGTRITHWDLVNGLCLDPHVCQVFMSKKVESGLARPAGLPGNYIVIGEENE